MIRQQFLTGTPIVELVKILSKNRINRKYYFDVIRVLRIGLISNFYSILDSCLYQKKIKKTQLLEQPIFILGHWRSGTTYLQKILAMDSQLATPTFYQCTFPQAFISAEKRLKPKIQDTLPETRIFDGMTFGVDEPFDDEFALLKLTTNSQMLHFVFPEDSLFGDKIKKYEFNAQRWLKSFYNFAQKLTYTSNRRLLFKSPMNTLRIKELLKLFPGAKFIYIHRRPDDIFVSSLHQARKLFEHNKLTDNETDIRAFVLSRYQYLFNTYEKDKKLIPESQLIEVAFETLEKEPISVIQSIYKKFNFSGFDKLLPDLNTYLKQNRHYKKNKYSLSEEDARLVSKEWSAAYDRYGYAKR